MSGFRRFGDGWSKITGLITDILRLPCMPLLLLFPKLCVVRFEPRVCCTVKELVKCVEPVVAAGDPRFAFPLRCGTQTRTCREVENHFVLYKVPAGSP